MGVFLGARYPCSPRDPGRDPRISERDPRGSFQASTRRYSVSSEPVPHLANAVFGGEETALVLSLDMECIPSPLDLVVVYTRFVDREYGGSGPRGPLRSSFHLPRPPRPCAGRRPGRYRSTAAHSSRFQNNCLAEMWSGPEEGSHLRLIDCCIIQL